MFTDEEIQELINEHKLLPGAYEERLKLKPKPGHREGELDLVGVKGSGFRLLLRQSSHNPLDFSIILAYKFEKTNQIFRLRRYNGKSHEHTNKLEGDKFYGFHIHMATKRYQLSSWKEDGYAEPTSRYATYEEALNCLLLDCGFEVVEADQMKLDLDK